MSYFSNKNDTNIDLEFGNEKSLNFHFDKRNYLLL